MTDKKKTVEASLRNVLFLFMMKVFESLHGGAALMPNWHLKSLCYYLEECARGDTTRFVVCMPPRSLKSVCASVALPLWILGHNPAAKIICVSYSDDLARTFAKQRRAIIASAWFHMLFPNLQFLTITEGEVITTKGGGIYTTSIGGTLTGRGADYLIIDDPIKGAGAMSEAERNQVIDWYQNTAYSRLDNKEKGVIIIVSQRVHTDDLVGRVLDDDWGELVIRAIATEDEWFWTGPKTGYNRKEGEPLHAAWESLESLCKTKDIIGTYNFEAQYQQNPVPLVGNLFDPAWLVEYETAPPLNEFDLVVQSWDFAQGTSAANDYSVCTVWGVKGIRYYLLHVFRRRLPFPQLLEAVKAMASEFMPHRVLVEEAGIGLSVVQSLKNTGLPFKGYRPQIDKEARAVQTTALLEQGRVLVPKKAEWLQDFIAEYVAFPNGKFDDQIDSLVQFLISVGFNGRPDIQLRVTSIGPGGSVVRHRDRYFERTGMSVFGGLSE
tara:strand:- start:3719 stop:5200 length:1482 start_codon:yes stop_codon:yes gene_type:complete